MGGEDEPEGSAVRAEDTATNVVSRSFAPGDLPELRHVVARLAAEAGLPGIRGQDLVLAVDEIASNALRHGGGTGRLELWTAEDKLWFRVTDRGPGLPSDLAPSLPEPNRPNGRGLWLASAVTDVFTLASGPDGTTVTAAMLIPST
jgi:anti-sigma regulatory factor (Ser/Thr protein kinase)